MPFEVFDELRKTPFLPRKRKERHVFEVEDGTLLGFAAFKDLHVSWKKVQRHKFLWRFQICGLSPRGQPVTPTSGMCMVLPWRMRTRPPTSRIWIGQAEPLVALLPTFLTGQPCPLPPLPPLTLPHSWFSSMMWMRRCGGPRRGVGCMSGPTLSSALFARSMV